MKKLLTATLALAALSLMATTALSADKKVLAIVVKGLDNPFFEQINLGCQKWNKENAGAEYECLYTGPASSADEAGEVQIVEDLLNRADVAAIAISPSNAPLMANLLKKVQPKIPVMTIDADLSKDDAGLRKTYLFVHRDEGVGGRVQRLDAREMEPGELHAGHAAPGQRRPQLAEGRIEHLLDHFRHEVQPVLDRRRPGLELGALVGLGDRVGAQRLYHVERVRHRLDAVGVHGLQLVDHAEDPVQAIVHDAGVVLGHGNARELRDAQDLVSGKRHCGAKKARHAACR